MYDRLSPSFLIERPEFLTIRSGRQDSVWILRDHPFVIPVPSTQAIKTELAVCVEDPIGFWSGAGRASGTHWTGIGGPQISRTR
jgi:hypothetical protein